MEYGKNNKKKMVTDFKVSPLPASKTTCQDKKLYPHNFVSVGSTDLIVISETNFKTNWGTYGRLKIKVPG